MSLLINFFTTMLKSDVYSAHRLTIYDGTLLHGVFMVYFFIHGYGFLFIGGNSISRLILKLELRKLKSPPSAC